MYSYEIVKHVWKQVKNKDFKHCHYCNQILFYGKDESSVQPCFKRFYMEKWKIWLAERNYKPETSTNGKHINYATGEYETITNLKNAFINEMKKLKKQIDNENKIKNENI